MQQFWIRWIWIAFLSMVESSPKLKVFSKEKGTLPIGANATLQRIENDNWVVLITQTFTYELTEDKDKASKRKSTKLESPDNRPWLQSSNKNLLLKFIPVDESDSILHDYWNSTEVLIRPNTLDADGNIELRIKINDQISLDRGLLTHTFKGLQNTFKNLLLLTIEKDEKDKFANIFKKTISPVFNCTKQTTPKTTTEVVIEPVNIPTVEFGTTSIIFFNYWEVTRKENDTIEYLTSDKKNGLLVKSKCYISASPKYGTGRMDYHPKMGGGIVWLKKLWNGTNNVYVNATEQTLCKLVGNETNREYRVGFSKKGEKSPTLIQSTDWVTIVVLEIKHCILTKQFLVYFDFGTNVILRDVKNKTFIVVEGYLNEGRKILTLMNDGFLKFDNYMKSDGKENVENVSKDSTVVICVLTNK